MYNENAIIKRAHTDVQCTYIPEGSEVQIHISLDMNHRTMALSPEVPVCM